MDVYYANRELLIQMMYEMTQWQKGVFMYASRMTM